MIYLRDKSQAEELVIKDSVISIARRFLEKKGVYSKEFIMETTGVTEMGFEEAIRRGAIMSCARKFCDHFNIEYLQNTLELNEEELKDLIKFKEGMKEVDKEA
ncbi:hypothetical protein [Candidatus Clostridium helianthi]|jgi:hypothetical protein|uniref:Uncharacterized protein n=1 Tax=Candidatus Clostridium helianthi TaxID=3381660 RepID=A0ABW8RZE3_9CLOT